MTATNHFRSRVAERIGSDVDADDLAAFLTHEIARGDSDKVVFVARLSRDGKRLFRFRLVRGGLFYALVDTNSMRCITVMPPGFRPTRQGGDSIYLKETDI